MARNAGPKMVQCYHCRHRFEVGGRAQSTSCPGCNKPLIVADQEITGRRGPIRELRTCGRVVIKKRGRLMAELIEAHGGIDCVGIIDAKRIISGALVSLGPKATVKGDLTAPAVSMKLGAKILGSGFAVPDDPLGLDDLPRPAGK